jgi:hypothetical protein
LRLTPLRSATLESFLSAAFSSLRLVLEQADNVVVTDALRPGDDGSIPGDLVMLDCLGRPNDGRIQDLLVSHFAGDFVRLADQAVDCGALHPLRVLSELLEHLVQPSHLVLRFFKMVLEGLGQVTIGGLLDEFWQRLDDLIFSVVDVLQPVQQKVVHCGDIFGEQAHGVLLWKGDLLALNAHRTARFRLLGT